MLLSTPIRLVVFDLGRVLIRICDSWQHAAAVSEFAGDLPVMTPELAGALHEVVTQSETGKIDEPTFYARCSELFGIASHHVQGMADAYLLGPFEGIEQLIADITAQGIKTACLSNTNSNHWEKMTADSGLNALPLHLLDYRFASHLVGLRKPDAAIYKHVEQATGCVPESILLFDDLPDNIVAAGHQGWSAVLVTDRENPVFQMRQALLEHGVLENA